MLSKSFSVNLKVNSPHYEMKINHVYDKVTNTTSPVIYFCEKGTSTYLSFYKFVMYILSTNLPMEDTEKGNNRI